MLFFAKLTDDHKNLLYSSFAETFTQLVEENAPEIVGEINPELKDFFTHSVFQTWKIFNNPFEGRRVVGAKRECLKIKLHFDDAVRMWKFIKIYISGTLDSLIEPIQTFLRTKEGFENLEMTVVLPDVFAALNQSGDSKEIDSNSMMCVLELLNQRLVPLEQNQQDDTVRKSLEMKRTSSQQYITNAGVQTGEMESEGPEETFVEIKERLVVEESKTPLVELHLDESGQTIMPLTSEDTETPIKGYTIENTGEKVMTTISKEPVKLVEELTVDESGQKVKTPMPKKSEKPIKELPIEISEKPMTILPTNVYEPMKELVSYTCGACFEDIIRVQYMVKCKDCDKILCSDCARVHRNSDLSRDHIIIVQQADDLINTKFKPAATITVEYPSHHRGGFLSDLFLLPRDKLLLGDWNDRKVKLVDLRTNNLLSQVSVPGHPMGMCLISENRVAVTLRITGMIGSIQFVEINGQLCLGESIKLDGGCLAIGYHNDRLIVSYRSGKVEKMDMSGKVIEKIDSDDSGKPVFGYPWQLTVVGEGQEAVLYVSDNYKNTITKLDMDLNILQTFEDPALREPAGITAVGNQLLICDRGSNNIMCLDLTSSQMTQLLKKNAEQNPKSVCYSQQQKRLYVTGEHDNVVSVYMSSITI
ncbi:uncharacterized protein LOC128236538 [Mya arenaria]|uniref:uncharacterized protein LOC128236538 n=1 Tax=Mya arenaria TaxID=6604 RepID=UPI0022E28CE3|nr:uncharacterized protein LOC128236538 [Mya arenaria]